DRGAARAVELARVARRPEHAVEVGRGRPGTAVGDPYHLPGIVEAVRFTVGVTGERIQDLEHTLRPEEAARVPAGRLQKAGHLAEAVDLLRADAAEFLDDVTLRSRPRRRNREQQRQAEAAYHRCRRS